MDVTDEGRVARAAKLEQAQQSLNDFFSDLDTLAEAHPNKPIVRLMAEEGE